VEILPLRACGDLRGDAISQEMTPPPTARMDFKWATCAGAICAEHTEHLATAKSRFAKHTDDTQVTLEQFNLLDTPSSATSQSSSNSSLPEESFHAAEHRASISNDGSLQKGKKRQAPGDGEFAASNEAKKVALIQQVLR